MIQLKHIYFVTFLLGTVMPLSQFIPFLMENGFSIPLFVEQLNANYISRFFKWDVLTGMLTLLVLIIAESRRIRLKRYWIPIVAGFCVGVSCGLPLFLFMREIKLEQTNNQYLTPAAKLSNRAI